MPTGSRLVGTSLSPFAAPMNHLGYGSRASARSRNLTKQNPPVTMPLWMLSVLSQSFPRSSTPPPPVAFHVMTKPIGPICNLDCKYCFYLEKEDMYAQEGRRPQSSWRMSDEVLETYIRQYIQQQDVPEINFAWQGGEPTLLGVDFFRQAVALQKKYADGRRIHNAFQTNATLLDDAWGEFLSEHRFLVGVSVDGPADLHDRYRVDKQARPTFERVMRGIGFLKKHGVEFNTLTVVNRANSQHPRRVYPFLKEIGSTFLQFIPLVDGRAAPVRMPPGLIKLSLAPPPTRRDLEETSAESRTGASGPAIGAGS